MIPFTTKRRGVETKIVFGDNDASPAKQDERLIETLAKADLWLARLTDGSCLSVQVLASAEQVHPAEISRLAPSPSLLQTSPKRSWPAGSRSA
jgi:site-specific DNA recombinase